ncbi:MAG TPA: sporulation transcriptional regulator SpoIIID [Candidatus Fournierella merdavium]|nr:sporulation transcriptional regulator SpoIIID [Candidatus Fournierella merdavium]
MKGNIDERALQLALYITEHRATVRSAAGAFGVSKSTVHMEVTKQNG